MTHFNEVADSLALVKLAVERVKRARVDSSAEGDELSRIVGNP